MTAAVTRNMRHLRAHPCQVCRGYEEMPRDVGKRCEGFTSADGMWTHCARPEHAGAIVQNDARLFAHKMRGRCKCGEEHGPAIDDLRIEGVYPYKSENGVTLFEVVRKIGKKFLQRHDDGHGRWIWNMQGVRRVPYRLPQLLQADPSKLVLILEGEKDVEAAIRLGFVATCNPGGAGKWSAVASAADDALEGRDVVVIADADKVGRAHAKEIAASFTAVRSVKIIELPQHDLSDFLAAGGTRDHLEAIVEAAPLVTSYQRDTTSDPTDTGFGDAWEGFDEDAANDEGPASGQGPNPSAFHTAEQVAREMASAGPVVRIPTGFETIDANGLGGFAVPRLVIVGGAPGAGKTTFTTECIYRFARAGYPVVALPVDEGREGTILRLAQIDGFSRAKLEAGDPEEWTFLADRLAALRIIIADPDEDGATVEGTVAALLAIRKGDEPAVLVVDSVQTVRSAGSDDADGPRARIDCVVKALKSATRQHKLLTLACCELARGAYRSKQSADQINDLAAFKESGSIEYAGQTLLVLRSVQGEEDMVDVAVPKNRGHKKAPFRLRLDRDRAGFTEVPLGAAEEGHDVGQNRQVEEDAQTVRMLLLERPGLHGHRELTAELRARGQAMGRGRLDAAVAKLGSEIEKRRDGKESSWFVRSAAGEGGAS